MGTDTTTLTSATLDAVAIGVTADSTPTADADGKFAEAAVWDKSLSASEVAALAGGFSPSAIGGKRFSIL